MQVGPLSGPGVDNARASVALILGVPVDDITMDETINRIFELVVDGRASGTSHQVATVNVDFVVNAVRDPELGALMRRTSLSIPDGMPIVWGSRLLASPLRTRVAGADLVAAIVRRAAADRTKVVLYGAAPGVAQRAADKLRSEYPQANVTGDAGPAFRNVDELTIADLAALRDLAPDICCVAFGNPKQERFIARFGQQLGIPVMIGVGGTLDFLVGEQRRAPPWMQRSGLEWVHRAASEPRRLGTRYVRDAGIFLPRLARQAWCGRRSRRVGRVRFDLGEDGTTIVDLTMLLVADNEIAGQIVSVLRAARVEHRPVEVRGASFAHLGSIPGLAELVALSA